MRKIIPKISRPDCILIVSLICVNSSLSQFQCGISPHFLSCFFLLLSQHPTCKSHKKSSLDLHRRFRPDSCHMCEIHSSHIGGGVIDWWAIDLVLTMVGHWQWWAIDWCLRGTLKVILRDPKKKKVIPPLHGRYTGGRKFWVLISSFQEFYDFPRFSRILTKYFAFLQQFAKFYVIIFPRIFTIFSSEILPANFCRTSVMRICLPRHDRSWHVMTGHHIRLFDRHVQTRWIYGKVTLSLQGGGEVVTNILSWSQKWRLEKPWKLQSHPCLPNLYAIV